MKSFITAFIELQKINDSYTLVSIKDAGNIDKIDSAQNQLLQAEKAFRQIVEKVEVNNTNLQSKAAINSLSHLISAYRLLLKFQRFESVSSNIISAKNTYKPNLNKPELKLTT